VPLVAQELLSFPEHLSSLSVLSGVSVSRCFAWCVCFVDRCLSFFYWSLCCLCLFDLRILITLWYLQTLLSIIMKKKDKTDKSASYLLLRLEIEERLSTKLYDKRDDLNFPIVNFPFICSNISAAYFITVNQVMVATLKVMISTHVTRLLVLCVCFVDCCLSFCSFLLAIVLFFLRFTHSDYPFGIFWPLCCLSFDLHILITPLVSSVALVTSVVLI
jgi:hypothetical protein